jgi:hypothetical protein
MSSRPGSEVTAPGGCHCPHKTVEQQSSSPAPPQHYTDQTESYQPRQTVSLQHRLTDTRTESVLPSDYRRWGQTDRRWWTRWVQLTWPVSRWSGVIHANGGQIFYFIGGRLIVVLARADILPGWGEISLSSNL